MRITKLTLSNSKLTMVNNDSTVPMLRYFDSAEPGGPAFVVKCDRCKKNPCTCKSELSLYEDLPRKQIKDICDSDDYVVTPKADDVVRVKIRRSNVKPYGSMFKGSKSKVSNIVSPRYENTSTKNNQSKILVN
jgi:hypothetical protein